MTIAQAETNSQLHASQLKTRQLTLRLEALPSANLSSVNLTKRLYICSLIARANKPSILAKPLLAGNIITKAEKALSELEASLQQQKYQAEQQLTLIEEEYEHVFEDAKSFLESNAYFELEQLFNSVKGEKNTYSFKELINEMAGAELAGGGLNVSVANQAEATAHKTKQTELQSFQQYQSMFEKMALDRLLSRVMNEIPENAGPLNPERLVIRSFKALQDISPDYLSQLISYYESLLTLQLFVPART